MIVLDASATVDLVLGTSRGGLVAERLSAGRDQLHAPHLLSVEACSALRRLASRSQIPPARVDLALRNLTQLPIRRWPHEPLLPRMWQLRAAVSAYDAAYVALAEALSAALVTTDARLARSSGHLATIDLVTG